MRRTEKTTATQPPDRGKGKPAITKGLNWSSMRANYDKSLDRQRKQAQEPDSQA